MTNATQGPGRAQRRSDEALARQILAHRSKSFALAGRLLPRRCRADAALLYAWCRRCDDAVDEPSEPAARAAAVTRLRAELDLVFGDADDGTAGPTLDPVLRGMRSVVRRYAIPRRWAEDLVDGMAMDVGIVRFATVEALLLYAYRAAGTVGLMMARLMGARGAEALRRAADLGIAMQLTNVCRDVAEDAWRGRIYLPVELLAGAGSEPGAATSNRAEGVPGTDVAPAAAPAARAVRALLQIADTFYASGCAGLRFLPLRSAIGVHAAALIYREIGREIERRGCDVLAGRAVVPRARKVMLVLRAALAPVALVQRWRAHPRVGAISRSWRRYEAIPAAPPALAFALPVTEGAA